MHLSSTNPRRHRLITAGLLAVMACGCGPSFRRFSEKQAEAVCRVTTTCFESHGNIDACVNDIGLDRDEVDRRDDCAGYLEARARQCLNALEDQADNCPTRDIADWRVPSICGEVCKEDRDAEPERVIVWSTDTAL